MLKILHLSDLHLNASFKNKRETVRDTLKEELLSSFERGIDYAIQNSVDLILVVGDVFDHPVIGFKLMKRFESIVKKSIDANIHFAYITGNHDPMDSVTWVKKLQNNELFHLIGSKEPVALKMAGKQGTVFNLYACGHEKKGENRNLIQNFPIKSDSKIWIGAAHASLDSYRIEDPYMPTTRADIEALNYNYFALGHIHQRDFISPKIAYSGSIQGMDISETGKKGGILVEIDEYGTVAKAIDFSNIQWKVVDIALDRAQVDDIEDLLELAHQKLELSFENYKDQHIIRVNLTGRTPLFEELVSSEACSYLEEELTKNPMVLDLEITTSRLEPEIDFEVLGAEKTVVSELLKNMENWHEIPELRDQILKLPIFSRTMTRDEKIEYVQTLMSSVKKECVNWMVKKTNEY